ncbi:hypothetical protein BH11ACT2_BH11ACT2_12660 [soil metagenome]
MGTLTYGSTGLQIELDDRVLTHLQVVIVAKLRRGEGFPFTWRDPESTGDGRGSIWLHSSIPLYFKYDSHDSPKINRTWLEILTISSNTAAGLRVVEEPAEQDPPARILA